MGIYHNEEYKVLESAARTSSVNSQDFENIEGRGVKLVIDVSEIADTPSVVFTIEGKDPASGKYYTLLTSAAVAAVGTTILTIYPGLTKVDNVAANDVLPRHWRVKSVHADADAITYSIGACTIR